MNGWMRRLHIWVGLLAGLQFVLWVGSGLIMSLLDADKVHGASTRARPAATARPWDARALPPGDILAAQRRPVDRLAAVWLGDTPAYRISHGKQTWLVHALDGQLLKVDASLAARLAAESYAGQARLAAPRLLASTLEARGHAGPLWRVDVLDADATSVYVSATTGQVLEHRNSTWRIFDVAWMLHIMDYRERTDFNHPLVIVSAVAGLLLVLGGLYLLVAGFVPRSARLP